MIELASRFRSFDANDLNKYTLPTVFDWDGPYSILRMLEAEAQIVLDVFRGGQTEKSFGIVLLNGTGVTGEASRIANELIAAGFRVAETGNAPSFDIERTTIYFDTSQKESALILQSHLLSGADLVQRAVETGLAIEMIFGRDYSGVSEAPVDLESEDEAALSENDFANGRIDLEISVPTTGIQAGFTDSVILTSLIANEQSALGTFTTSDNQEEDIEAALQRAGKIRGC